MSHPDEHLIPLGETSLRYHRYAGDADATPILLLHPWFGCHRMWAPFATRAPQTSYAVDWYSLSSGDWSSWASPEGLAEAALALLDTLGHDRVDVVGNSVGGIVAQLLAVARPERVRRLVLVGTGASLGGPPTAFGTLVGRWLSEPEEHHELTTRLVRSLVARPLEAAELDTYVAAVEAADPAFVAAVLEGAKGLDLRPRLATITAPTLVIRGEHDTARTRTHVDELLAGIEGAVAVEMPGCGHSPMIEEVDEFTALVRRHLDEKTA